jgi:hypothetical protein
MPDVGIKGNKKEVDRTQNVVTMLRQGKSQIPSPLSKLFELHRYLQIIFRLHLASGRDAGHDFMDTPQIPKLKAKILQLSAERQQPRFREDI